MKKSLLFIIAFSTCFFIASAQITITSTDMPSDSTIIYQASDTLTNISIGNAGPNQVWDFSSLLLHTFEVASVLPFSSAPNPAFPAANLVYQNGTQNFFQYAINSNSSFVTIGSGGQTTISGNQLNINQFNTPAETEFNFPTNYNSTYSNNFASNAKFYFGQTIQGITIDSIKNIAGVQKTFLVDAWGDLTTPLAGGPYSVLRTKTTKITHDTTMAFFFGGWNNIPGGISVDSVTTYSWWANGMSAPLATATMDSAGAVSNVVWLMAIPPNLPSLTAIADQTNASCAASCDGTAAAMVYWGTPPYSYSWNTSPVQTTQSISGLCAGIYSVSITDSLNLTVTLNVNVANEPSTELYITAIQNIISIDSVSGAHYQWFLNDTIITNANSSEYYVTQNGNYNVYLTNANGCTDSSDTFVFNTIGINESFINENVFIFPNPASNQITIKFDSSVSKIFKASKQNILIDIKNELGQTKKTILKQMENGKNELVLDLYDLPSGIYFIKFQNNNISINKKFIKL